MSAKVFVSTHPFGKTSPVPMKLLADAGLEVVLNPFGRKIQTPELRDLIHEFDFLIAGTEKLDSGVFEAAKKLKLISRVGIGLDGVNFDEANSRGIKVAYTPDAPTLAVAELTLAVMLDAARKISETDRRLRTGTWKRHMGQLLAGKTVGLAGLGRIGKSVVHLLRPFNVQIIATEPEPDLAFVRMNDVELTSKTELLKRSDFLSIHIPLNDKNRDYIRAEELGFMKPDSFLINTARGGIVNENDLLEALTQGRISGAAVDVFEQEPYSGPLATVENCVLTCHMGASTVQSRSLMETEAAQEVVRFIQGEPLKNPVTSNG